MSEMRLPIGHPCRGCGDNENCKLNLLFLDCSRLYTYKVNMRRKRAGLR